MKIAGYEKMSLVDYDGKVACTVFTSGCNFRCGFCHNSALVVPVNGFPQIDEKEFFSYLEKRRGILDGVCVSGGEPTLSNDLISFCERIKSLGYSIKLDTNGTNPDIVKKLASEKLCDYFAMDIKSSLSNYPLITNSNVNVNKVSETVEFFLSGQVDYEFRTTIFKEFHTKEEMQKIGEWIKGAKKYFLQKFVSGENCIEQGFTPIDEQLAKEFLEILKPNIPNVNLRGY